TERRGQGRGGRGPEHVEEGLGAPLRDVGARDVDSPDDAVRVRRIGRARQGAGLARENRHAADDGRPEDRVVEMRDELTREGVDDEEVAALRAPTAAVLPRVDRAVIRSWHGLAVGWAADRRPRRALVVLDLLGCR